MGQACTVQLEFKRPDGQPLKTVAVKGRKEEVETLPLFTNKDSVQGEVRGVSRWWGWGGGTRGLAKPAVQGEVRGVVFAVAQGRV